MHFTIDENLSRKRCSAITVRKRLIYLLQSRLVFYMP